MTNEIEAKFLHVHHDEVQRKLQKLGARLEQPMRLMRRVTIDTDIMKRKDAFLRVRDEGHRVTMTYKQFDSLSIDGAKEIEVTVSDFEATVALLEACGLRARSFQESKRETWKLGACEVVLDVWPWLDPYIEIEGESEKSVRTAAQNLGFDWSDAKFGDVMVAYRDQYPKLTAKGTVGNIPKVEFGQPLPDLLR